MMYFLGNQAGERRDRRTFKTIAGAKRSRHDLLDDAKGVKILRDGEDGIEIYCGISGPEEQWMQIARKT